MVIGLLAWSVTVIPWPNQRSPCATMEVDWRTHFLGDLIINCYLSRKLQRVQISWIPVTLQTDWRLSDTGCCGALSVASGFHASWWTQSGDLSQSLTCAATLKNHYSQLSLPLIATLTHAVSRDYVWITLNVLKLLNNSIKNIFVVDLLKVEVRLL